MGESHQTVYVIHITTPINTHYDKKNTSCCSHMILAIGEGSAVQ